MRPVVGQYCMHTRCLDDLGARDIIVQGCRHNPSMADAAQNILYSPDRMAVTQIMAQALPNGCAILHAGKA